MRRKDREVIERVLQQKIIEKADAVRIAFAVQNEPYIVAMSFGYVWDEKLRLYMHSAREGKKIDMLWENSRVCFQMDTGALVEPNPFDCRWTMKYASIVGRGELCIVDDPEERDEGLSLIMRNYGKKGNVSFAAEMVHQTRVLRLDVDEISVKHNG